MLLKSFSKPGLSIDALMDCNILKLRKNDAATAKNSAVSHRDLFAARYGSRSPSSWYCSSSRLGSAAKICWAVTFVSRFRKGTQSPNKNSVYAAGSAHGSNIDKGFPLGTASASKGICCSCSVCAVIKLCISARVCIDLFIFRAMSIMSTAMLVRTISFAAICLTTATCLVARDSSLLRRCASACANLAASVLILVMPSLQAAKSLSGLGQLSSLMPMIASFSLSCSGDSRWSRSLLA